MWSRPDPRGSVGRVHSMAQEGIHASSHDRLAQHYPPEAIHDIMELSALAGGLQTTVRDQVLSRKRPSSR